MQRRLLLGAGAVVLVVVAAIGVRSIARRQVGKALDQTVEQIIAQLPPGYSATHGASEVNPITGTLTVHGMAVSRDGALLWSADTMSVTGADQQALRDVFDPAAYPNGHPAWAGKRLLIADASASGVRIPGRGRDLSEVTIKTITLRHLSGRPFMQPPTQDHLAKPDFQADAASAFALQSLDLHDVAAAARAPRTARLAVESLGLHDYDGGFVGEASLLAGSLEVAQTKPGGAGLHGSLDSVTVKRLDARGALDRQRQRQVADRASLAGLHYASFQLSGFAIEGRPGPRFAVHDMEAHLPAGDGSGTQTGTGSMTGMSFALKDTVVPEAAAAPLAAFGMNAVTVDMTAKSRASGAPLVSEVSEDIVLHDLGTLHIAGGFSGYDPSRTNASPRAVLMSTILDHATIEWDDASLINRAFAAAAAQMHTTPDVLRAQLAVPMATLGVMMPDQPDAADQVTAFLQHPHILTVTLSPPGKISLADVGKAPMQERAHLLGVRVIAR